MSVSRPSGHDFLYLVQFVERLHGREVVDVQTYYLVAYLAEHGVVQLEERQLYALNGRLAGDVARGELASLAPLYGRDGRGCGVL